MIDQTEVRIGVVMEVLIENDLEMRKKDRSDDDGEVYSQ